LGWWKREGVTLRNCPVGYCAESKSREVQGVAGKRNHKKTPEKKHCYGNGGSEQEWSRGECASKLQGGGRRRDKIF